MDCRETKIPVNRDFYAHTQDVVHRLIRIVHIPMCIFTVDRLICFSRFWGCQHGILRDRLDVCRSTCPCVWVSSLVRLVTVKAPRNRDEWSKTSTSVFLVVRMECNQTWKVTCCWVACRCPFAPLKVPVLSRPFTVKGGTDNNHRRK